MAHDINSALERLEKNLSELDSARSQVLQSVNASNDLVKMVTQYVTAVKNLAANLEKWETSLRGRESELNGEFGSAIISIRQTCSEVISAFNVDVSKASSDFKKDTDKTLVKFAEQNDKLAERVAELVALREQIKKATNEILVLKDSLDQISKDLKESQEAQDKTLNDIQQKVIELPASLHSEAVSVIQSITSVETSLTDVITGSKNELDNKIATELSKIELRIVNVESLCEGISSSVETFSGQITSILTTLKNSEQSHYNAIVKQLGEQEKRLNTEFDVVRKQNSIFSFVIIILLAIIISLFIFMKPI